MKITYMLRWVMCLGIGRSPNYRIVCMGRYRRVYRYSSESSAWMFSGVRSFTDARTDDYGLVACLDCHTAFILDDNFQFTQIGHGH